MHAMLNIAVRAARAAGNIIARGYESRDDLMAEHKGDNDYVTRIDREAEQAIISKIQQSYPSHSFVGEEGGIVEGDETYKWIIDPLDGTTNFIKGIPHFAVSIALMHKGRLDQAVVFDPMRGELFTATKGSGAQLNGYRIRCSKSKDLGGTVLATAFPFKNKDEQFDDSLTKFSRIYRQCGDIRRAGSAALDMAYVAAGRFDGFWEKGLKPWDMAAGALLVQEAGGLVTDFTGGHEPMKNGNVVCGGAKVVQALVKSLKD
ncbi:inositol-1-monophosphatase [Bowmanella dokdonensis]|uniref:Inositol-1-monophosphatase n=1 Tax=Bowmanella dokdonensis TaxID=751969 RepID=A0A939INJ9_9ALTE|nr:inositol-1-monophosphatase [Bowmanella dokdonensis]MBN7826438.1 inositol-1-monophosphatase [Bowmanella dokdonensis]